MKKINKCYMPIISFIFIGIIANCTSYGVNNILDNINNGKANLIFISTTPSNTPLAIGIVNGSNCAVAGASAVDRANCLCQAEASGKLASNKIFYAWLSQTTTGSETNAKCNVTGVKSTSCSTQSSKTPMYSIGLGGDSSPTRIANSFSDLLNGKLLAPIYSGAGLYDIITGTSSNGTLGQACDGAWNSGIGSMTIGNSNASDVKWTDDNNTSICNTAPPRSFYCFSKVE